MEHKNFRSSDVILYLPPKIFQMAKFCLSILFVLTCLITSAQDGKLAQPDLKGDLMLDLGFNYWMGDRDTTKAFPSRSIGVYYTQRIRISDKFSFYPAVGFGTDKYSFRKNYHLRNNDGVIEVDSTNAIIKRNKMIATYLDIPLELRYHPRGTQEGEGFFIGAGVIGGFKMSAHTKVKYVQNDHKRTEKLNSNFGLSDVRYGIQFRFGWKGAHLFFKKYFNNTYRIDQALVNPDLNPTGQFFNPTTTTVGINFTGF